MKHRRTRVYFEPLLALTRPPMGAHAWWSFNMPMFIALLNPELIGKPPVIQRKAAAGKKFEGTPV